MSKDLPERKRNRLKGYNYNLSGAYFLTICTKNREFWFGDIQNYEMHLYEYGKIANQYWMEIESHFNNIELDEFVIMPNHIHGIINLPYVPYVRNESFPENETNVGNADLHSLRGSRSQQIDRTKMMIPKIIHGFKSSVTRKIRKEYNDYKFAWQKSYHDHIIRNEEDLFRKREYIKNNPVKWKEDDYWH